MKRRKPQSFRLASLIADLRRVTLSGGRAVFLMKEIKLTQGKVALVDDEDYPKLSKFTWYAQKSSTSTRYYARRSYFLKSGRKVGRLMHRVILGLRNPKITVDHKDLNGLNNQRHNLRIANGAQQIANAGMYKNNKSGFKGVCWSTQAKKWVATVTLGRNFFLGHFRDRKAAARAYDREARKLFGEFARVNFPTEHEAGGVK